MIISGYGNAAYNRCLGPPGASPLLRFAALDLRLARAENSEQSTQVIMTAVKRLQAQGAINVRADANQFSVRVEPRVGQNLAVISSYQNSTRSCAFARDDVDEFAALLRGSPVSGREISELLNPKQDRLVVAVDFYNNSEAAKAAAGVIREAASKSYDRRTGWDAIVSANEGLRVTDSCNHMRIIP